MANQRIGISSPKTRRLSMFLVNAPGRTKTQFFRSRNVRTSGGRHTPANSLPSANARRIISNTPNRARFKPRNRPPF